MIGKKSASSATPHRLGISQLTLITECRWWKGVFQVRRLLQPTSTPVGRAQGSAPAGTAAAMAANAPMLPFIEGAQTGPSVLSVLMGVKSLQVCHLIRVATMVLSSDFTRRVTGLLRAN